MTRYDLYDSYGNRIGEIRSRDYEYGDWSPSYSQRSADTWPASILLIASSILILWSAWFICRYGITFFMNQYTGSGISWAGINRGTYNGGNVLIGIIVILGALVYVCAEFFFMWFILDQVSGRVHFAHALLTGILVSAFPLMIFVAELSHHGGLFFYPAYHWHLIHLLTSIFR